MFTPSGLALFARGALHNVIAGLDPAIHALPAARGYSTVRPQVTGGGPMPKTPDYFKGKTIVITGAGSGIGRAAALIFAREGANIVCADINENGVEQTAEMIDAQAAKTNTGGKPLALTIDVTKRAAVGKSLGETVREVLAQATKPTKSELVEAAGRIRAMSPYSAVDSTDLIREDRENDEPYR
jgi:glutamate dehydrogenase/leucine dehydrogenase